MEGCLFVYFLTDNKICEQRALLYLIWFFFFVCDGLLVRRLICLCRYEVLVLCKFIGWATLWLGLTKCISKGFFTSFLVIKPSIVTVYVHQWSSVNGGFGE